MMLLRRPLSLSTVRPKLPTMTSRVLPSRAFNVPTDKTKDGKAPMPARPSSSIMLVSPTNQLLLLQRVQTSSAFPSAHVFPGGNLSTFHENVPAPDAPDRHLDGPSYRLAAIRETFEESGILLASPKGSTELIRLAADQVEAGRKATHGNKVKFADWVQSLGAEPDVDNLIPFTRWITPVSVPKRFSTQMYVYMLPLESGGGSTATAFKKTVVHTPTHDGGLEHTTAEFDDVSNWLAAAAKGDITLFPPQVFLLHLLGQFFTGSTDYSVQRENLKRFLQRTPTGPSEHALSQVSWADKCISPVGMPLSLSDGRSALSLVQPGLELKGTDRGGDFDRVVLVRRSKQGPKDVEVRWRSDVEEEAKNKATAKL